MNTIQVKNVDGVTLPTRGSELSTGYDIIAVDDPVIVGESITKEGEFFPYYKRVDYIEYHTKLFISPQLSKEEYTYHNINHLYTLLYPRSSIRKYNLVLANSIGLIDNDYRGELILCFKYIWQPEDFIIEFDHIPSGPAKLMGKLNREKIYKKGDKIGQLVAEKTNPIQFILVSELDATARGEGGFGSTDTSKLSASYAAEVTTNPSIIKIEGTFSKSNLKNTPGRMYPQEVTNKEIEAAEKSRYEDAKVVTGHIIDRYQKAGGIPIRKKYSDEIKERDNS